MRLTNTRSVAISLALCAMVLRALLPDGWMPAPAGSTAPFVICSIDGVHTGGKSDTSRERTHAPCAFSVAAHLSPPHVARLAVPEFTVVEHVAFASAGEPIVFRAPHRANAPRAPPAFS